MASANSPVNAKARRPSATRYRLVALSGVAFGCSSWGAGDAELECGVLAAPLYGGSPESAGAGIDDAVAGGVLVPAARGEVREFCTLSRVAPGWLLTAAHCVSSEPLESVRLTFGPSVQRASPPRMADEPSGCGPEPEVSQSEVALTSFPVSRSVLHPSLDLALLQIPVAEGPSLSIAEHAGALGEDVLLVGYGLQETGNGGIQELLWARVSELTDTLIVVVAEAGGACVGDSGGPLLRPTGSGSFELIGVLSSGSDTCTQFDNYVDITLAAEWIAETLQP